MGLKHLKEMSLVQSVCQGVHFSKDHPNNEYAAGFASTEFIMWNLTAETKVYPFLLNLFTFLIRTVMIFCTFNDNRLHKSHVVDGADPIPFISGKSRRGKTVLHMSRCILGLSVKVV